MVVRKVLNELNKVERKIVEGERLSYKERKKMKKKRRSLREQGDVLGGKRKKKMEEEGQKLYHIASLIKRGNFSGEGWKVELSNTQTGAVDYNKIASDIENGEKEGKKWKLVFDSNNVNELNKSDVENIIVGDSEDGVMDFKAEGYDIEVIEVKDGKIIYINPMNGEEVVAEIEKVENGDVYVKESRLLEEEAVSIEKIRKALANKRGDGFMQQVEDIEVLAQGEEGVILQITKISGNGTEKLGDFLTPEELESVEVMREREKAEEIINKIRKG